MKKSAKILCAVLALVLTLGIGVGGTLAYITKVTEHDVVNTFAFGNFDLTLTEPDYDNDHNANNNKFTIVPGTNIEKDPVVTVKTPVGTEPIPCYVFVKVTEKDWPTGNKVSYKLVANWKKLDGATDIYYWDTLVTAASPTELHILNGGIVTVSPDLTKADVDACKNKVPTLTFKAYAVQRAGSVTAGEAWEKVPADQK